MLINSLSSKLFCGIFNKMAVLVTKKSNVFTWLYQYFTIWVFKMISYFFGPVNKTMESTMVDMQISIFTSEFAHIVAPIIPLFIDI